MPALAPPFETERDGLVAYVAQQLDAFRAVAYGLTDEQARSTPTPSSLSVGALVKHATAVSRGWIARAVHAPQPPPPDDRPFQERVAAYQDEFVMRADETLAAVLDRFDAQAERTLQALREADPDTPVPVPGDAPWFPRDVEQWSVRWVALHLVEELARHAGLGLTWPRRHAPRALLATRRMTSRGGASRRVLGWDAPTPPEEHPHARHHP